MHTHSLQYEFIASDSILYHMFHYTISYVSYCITTYDIALLVMMVDNDHKDDVRNDDGFGVDDYYY